MTKIEVGSAIPITLQAFDRNVGLEVTATVIDDVGVTIAQKKLHHTQGGLYLGEAVAMPDVKFVTVQFAITPDDYETVADVFIAIPKPRPLEKYIVGQVQSKSESNEYIIGVVTNEKN